MSFWKSREHKARKVHKCLYCGRTIEVGEIYDRETGVFEGDFNDYCLCLRCLFLVDKYERNGDELGNFYDTLLEQYLMPCPSCDSINLRTHNFSKDKMSCECECGSCGEKWTADLSIEGIKKRLED